MGLKVYWLDFAKKELQSIHNYYLEVAGIRVAEKITKEIIIKADTISNYPQSCQTEPNLVHRSENYRYLIYKNFKNLYSINPTKSRIEINDIFDCRQKASKMLKIRRDK